MATTKKDVEDHLAEVGRLIAARRFLFVQRPKNADALVEPGMTATAAVIDVARLTASDYVSGPDEDRDRPGQQCWVFGLDVAGREVYVKLVVDQTARGPRLKVLSFHQAEWSLRYPFR
jgi:hypothetical protein